MQRNTLFTRIGARLCTCMNIQEFAEIWRPGLLGLIGWSFGSCDWLWIPFVLLFSSFHVTPCFSFALFGVFGGSIPFTLSVGLVLELLDVHWKPLSRIAEGLSGPLACVLDRSSFGTPAWITLDGLALKALKDKTPNLTVATDLPLQT